MNDGKPNWKRAGFFAALAVVIIVVYVVLMSGPHKDRRDDDSSDTSLSATTEPTETVKPPEEVETKPEVEESSSKIEEPISEPETEEKIPQDTGVEPSTSSEPKEEVPHRDGMYGISDKDVHDIDGTFSRNKVRNDATGNWKISTIAADVQMVDYALSYYEWYIHSDNEVHAIVNFTLNTTTCIQSYGDQIYVTVHDYVDGEEHDANLLFSGAVLADYIVYADNGDIEQIQ